MPIHSEAWWFLYRCMTLEAIAQFGSVEALAKAMERWVEEYEQEWARV